MMAAPVIQLTPEKLQQMATELSHQKTSHDNSVNILKNMVKGLLSSWRGEAQNAFSASFNSKEPNFNRFSEAIGKLASELNKFATNMAAEEKKRANEIR